MSSGFGVQVAAFRETFRRVKLLVLDVDGVLTDGLFIPADLDPGRVDTALHGSRDFRADPVSR